MNLITLATIMKNKHVSSIYVKKLRANDNSKNQIYLSTNLEALNIFPLQKTYTDLSNVGGGKIPRLKAKVKFYWLKSTGEAFRAPNANVIYYPEYPETRLSGFLQGAEWHPDHMGKERIEGRYLFLGVSDDRSIYGFVAMSDSSLKREFLNFSKSEQVGLFTRLLTDNILGEVELTPKQLLIKKLRAVVEKGWIASKRLTPEGSIDCNSSNCGGYTLESEFGILPNGKSGPDFMGWELKQFRVKKFGSITGGRITLMTPEPDGGFYREAGAKEFVRKYGYADKNGRPNRRNFGGTYSVGETTSTTNLRTELKGYDPNTKTITDPLGKLVFYDRDNQEAASWSFSKIINLWMKKHANACYVPSIFQKEPRMYRYGWQALLFEGTSVNLFLHALYSGNIFLDPGLKVERDSERSKTKMRNQFRIKSSELSHLYTTGEIVDFS